jgi:glycosyltransferase involved in cell wall biosynthesis
MNVLIVSGGYPTDNYPLNGTFQFEQAMALHDAGHEVTFAVADLRSLRRHRKLGLLETERGGIKVISMSVPVGALPPQIVGRTAVFAVRSLFQYSKKIGIKPEIVHAHFAVYYGMAAAENMSLLPNARLVVTEHDSGINEEVVDKYTISCMGKAYNKAGAVIAVGIPLQAKIRSLTGVEAKYIPNMYNDKLFFPNKNPEVSWDHLDPFRFVSVGSLIKRKRTERLIEAFSHAFQSNSNVNLVIIGDGPERPILAKMIQELRLQDQVALVGAITRKEIASVFRKSHCFVTASENETFGLACIEALACGLPVIATRCNGPEYFIDDTNGILVDVGDGVALKKALMEMTSNRLLYDTKKIVQSTAELFSPRAVISSIGGVYEKAYLSRV